MFDGTHSDDDSNDFAAMDGTSTLCDEERLSVTAVADNVWIHKDFLKDKVRVKERYWRTVNKGMLRPHIAKHMPEDSYWLIPDGLCWRKYLPLLTHMVEKNVCNLILLESAVELMDFRSTNPCVSTKDSPAESELAGPNERSKIEKLLKSYPHSVLPFCDLICREVENDEWDLLGFEKMGVLERSGHSLLRAARLVQQNCISVDPVIRNLTIVALSTDAEFVDQFASQDEAPLELLDTLLARLVDSVPQAELDAMHDLKKQCEERYTVRNTPGTKKESTIIASADYLSSEEIEEGLRNRSLSKGRLIVSRDNAKEAFIQDSRGNSFFLDQKKGHWNRSMNQDIVVVQPLPSSEWGRPVGRRRLVFHRDQEGDDIRDGEENLDQTPTVPTARVVAISNMARRIFVTTLVDTPGSSESSCLVVPMDMRIPKIRIRTSAWRKFVGNRLLVQIGDWELESNYPSGHCVEILGPIAELETEITCLLHENELLLTPFSAAALASLPPEGNQWKIPSSEFESRRDLRTTHHIFSVDPPGCQDIDDTMHAKILPNGDVEVGVHIADVTFFVPHNSPLDIEAQRRGTTFYLVDRRFDMLPSLLSSDLCSLHGGVDRLAVSTIWTLSSDLKEVKSFWFGRSIIHNAQAMTYDQADRILHDLPPEEPGSQHPPPLTAGSPVNAANVSWLKKDLSILTDLARKLRGDREEIGGAVDLSSGDQGSELKFTLDDNKTPTKVMAKKQKEIHHTIAELMILANTWVAKTIFEKSPDRALLRIHRTAEESRFEDLKEVLEAGKISFDGSTNMSLAKSLKGAEQTTKSATLMSLFQSFATRAMSEAQYISTGDIQGNDGLSHYGLGLKTYTHFTSPIRRYADVVVHKQLLSAFVVTKESHPVDAPRQQLASLPASEVKSLLCDNLNEKEGVSGDPVLVVTPEERVAEKSQPIQSPYEPQAVNHLCEQLNNQNRMAKISSFECQGLFLSLYFRQHVEETAAVVTSLRNNGFWVYIPQFDMRGPVYLCDSTGNVQMDRRFFQVSESAGEPPTMAFRSSVNNRLFPAGVCTVIEGENPAIEVKIPESETRFKVRVLDVVSVVISCPEWDARSRVPRPSIQLVPQDDTPTGTNRPSFTSMPQPISIESKMMPPKNDRTAAEKTSDTVYSSLQKLEVEPVLRNIQLRQEMNSTAKATESRIVKMPGRISFGSFRNPDTPVARQEVIMQESMEAMEIRRQQITEYRTVSSRDERSQQIEKDATSRMQRIAASKRNTRKAKGK